MATASTSSRMFVRGAAVMAAGVALTADIGLNEHPTHSVVLGSVAVAVWTLHRRLTRHAIALTTLPAVSAALAAQPVLHLASEIGRPPTGSHDYASLLHIFASDAPAAAIQVVVPVIALVATALVTHLFCLLNGARCPPTMVGATFEAPARILSPIRVRRLGSMLHWCGWVLQAARRGPPPTPGHAIS